MPYICSREGCPQPTNTNHYHCGRCKHPEITSQYGHFQMGRFVCKEREGNMRRVEKDREQA